jgi:hypothetical protein
MMARVLILPLLLLSAGLAIATDRPVDADAERSVREYLRLVSQPPGRRPLSRQGARRTRTMRYLYVLLIVGGFDVLPARVHGQGAKAASLETVRSWLRVVASGELEILAQTTALPFVYATTAKVKRCERTIATASELGPWLKCLREDEVLVGELRKGELMPSVPPNVESSALKQLGSSVPGAGQWVEAYINGDGVTYTFRMLVRRGAIAAFLVEAEFETG